jgi:diaphanous 1
MPPARIRAAVWDVDDSVLDVDQLAMVARMLPTHDEVRSAFTSANEADEQAEKLRRFEGDRSKLAKPDQFFMDVSCLFHSIVGTANSKIMAIPRLKQRVEVMLLRRRFDIQLAEILPDLGILKSAAVEIKASSRLRDVLAVSGPSNRYGRLD